MEKFSQPSKITRTPQRDTYKLSSQEVITILFKSLGLNLASSEDVVSLTYDPNKHIMLVTHEYIPTDVSGDNPGEPGVREDNSTA